MNTFIAQTENILWGKEPKLCRAIFAIGAIQCKIGFFSAFRKLDDADPFNGLLDVVNMAKEEDSLKHPDLDPECMEEYQEAVKEMAAHELVPDSLSDEEWVHLRVSAQRGIDINSLCENLGMAKSKSDIDKAIQRYQLSKDKSNDDDEDGVFEPDPANPLPPIDFCLESGEVPFLPKEDFFAIKAKAKNGKSHLASLLIAALISPNGYSCGIERTRINPYKVLWIDTEQSWKITEQLEIATLKLAGLDCKKKSDNLKVKNVRKKRKEKRKDYVKKLLSESKYDCLVIDGLKDFSINYNDVQDSLETIQYLLDISTDYNIAVLTVLHENPDENNSKMKGNLGSEAVDKCFGVLEVKYNKDTQSFDVTNTDNRTATIPAFSFGIDLNGGMYKKDLSITVTPDERSSRQRENEIREITLWVSFFDDRDKGYRNTDLALKYALSKNPTIDKNKDRKEYDNALGAGKKAVDSAKKKGYILPKDGLYYLKEEFRTLELETNS